MAVTKIKPIRGTVNKAISYILSPKKADDKASFQGKHEAELVIYKAAKSLS